MGFFKYEEFECKCGCGLNNISDVLVEKLNTARRLAGVPFVITSGSRCTEHNAKIGGSKTSSHLKGLAVDIKANDSRIRYLILTALVNAGFNRIGIAKDFIHVDIDEDKTDDVVWVY